MRTIKKYPNRRLYDTESSSYITLASVRKMVMQGVDFEIVNANTNEEITRSILLQIILEQESDGEHLFTSDMLSKFIRYCQDDTRAVFSQFLEKTMSYFVDQQSVLQKQFMDAISSNPIDSFTELANQNMDMWKDVQKSFFDGFSVSRKKSD